MDWVIDTDMGLDDQIALLYFATLSNKESSNFKLKAVTTQGVGLAHAQSAKENAIRLLRFAGISSADLPAVGTGDQDTLDGYHQYPSEWRYPQDALNGAIVPSYSEDIAKQNNQSTALLKKILSESSEKVSILAIGAHTTLAKVLTANPELANKIERVVSMVGAVYVDGNIKEPPSINKKAEFNAWIDPVASKILFDSGVPIKMVPLDVTDKAKLTKEFIDRFRAGTQGPVANVMLKWWENAYKSPVGEYYHWDPLATVIALFPDIATRTEAVKISVQAGLVPETSVPYGSIDDFSLLNWQGKLRSSLDPQFAGWTKPDNAGKSVDVVLDSNVLGFEDRMISAFAPKYRFAFISDTGGPIASSTSFYYNTTNNNFVPTNSLGPGPSAVSSLVQSWKPSEIFAIGDLSYNVGASTTIDAAIGQYYNNFIYPYPSKQYLGKPYDKIKEIQVKEGELKWPYNVYNYPVGFPNPIVTNQIGGSPDKLNHFWSALGNHDYGLEIGYAQIGATPYSINGKAIGDPVGPTSAPTFQSFIDYFLPFLNDPTILGVNNKRLNIGSSDISVNNGAYYSMSFAGTEENPLVEVFLLDTERLNINAGLENWNPSGKKEFNSEKGLYEDKVVPNPKGGNDDGKKHSLEYNPADPKSVAFNGTTTNPDNGFKQFEWLTKSLSSSKAKWKILTGHHPVYASGRWEDTNPDDHMSNAFLQKFLKALPVGSFDAFYNGHDHFYERVLETNSNGIGLGIPFITNGNNGRNLEAKIQIPYGTSLYNPPNGGSGKPDPNKFAIPYLLDSNPIVVGSSGLSGTPKDDPSKYTNGLYGYGFGAVKLDFGNDYLFFNYQEAPLIDPAISNHLAGGINPEQGFNNTTSIDWTPNPDGNYNAATDLATFKLSITNGVINKVEIINKGQGYMSSKSGNHKVTGFNIYGNNVDIKKPWLGTAQVDLTFSAGKLENINLTDGGIGYDLAVKATAENNNATTTDGLDSSRDLIVAINYNLDEIQYKVRDNSLYNDWYLITDTIAQAKGLNSGGFGSLEVSIQPESQDARNIIANTSITTGYNSNERLQQKYDRPQAGILELVDSLNQRIGNGTINNGFSELNLTQRAAPGALSLSFSGDPSSSYLINFKPSTTSLALDYGNWQGLVEANPNNSLVFNESATLSMIRTDSNAGLVNFGLAQGTTALNLLNDAAPASDKSINLLSIYNGSGWQTSEGKSVGSISSKGVKIQAGTWTPTAKLEGIDLVLQSVNVAGNNITAIFEDGITGSIILPGTGTAKNPSNIKPQLTVKRLGSYQNGLAFYEADSITGAVGGLLPGQAGYIGAALANARGKNLLLQADQLPSFGESSLYDSLPIQADTNYGMLLLVNGSESNVFSSYSAANPGGSQQFLSFGSSDRGITVGIEDILTSNGSDKDYNDLIVMLTSSNPSVIGNIY